MSATEPRYALLWKGRQLGTFTLEEIRFKLSEGEIGLMHQVNVGGQWQPLDELLANENAKTEERNRQQEAQRVAAQEAQRRAQEAQRHTQEAENWQRHEQELADERAKRDELADKLEALETQFNQQRTLPPLPSLQAQQYPPFTMPQGQYYQPQKRMSGMAITALVMGLLNFVPFVNFISWLFAIIFGHLALSQIKEDPMIEGRGMAVAGLVITYTLIGVGCLFVILASIGYARVPRF